MSSPDAPQPASLRVQILRLSLVCGLSAALAGCFQPMYAQSTGAGAGAGAGTAATPSLRDKMGEVEIVKIEGRLGNELRNDIIFELTGGAGNPVGAPYRMYISVLSNSAFSIVDTASGLPENKIIHVQASWRIVRAGEENKPPLATGKASGSASIDVSDQRFANYRATRDAESRASRMVTDQIRAQLADFFLHPPGS